MSRRRNAPHPGTHRGSLCGGKARHATDWVQSGGAGRGIGKSSKDRKGMDRSWHYALALPLTGFITLGKSDDFSFLSLANQGKHEVIVITTLY